MNTVKIKSTHKESQGDFIKINSTDFNKDTMQLHESEKPVEAKPKARPKARAKK
jgi:hypothetical protein